ncbi:MAG TPA: PQQ-binding-like beta-propeller repeat protein, partial [Urbifossiella sp.]
MSIRLLFALGLFSSTTVGLVYGDDWPQFRGLNGSATSREKNLPTEWSTDKNVAWKVKLPGYGWSCPVVWGDKVFVTTAVSEKQQKPSGGFGGGKGGFGGGKGGGGGGFGPGGGGMKGRVPDTLYKWELHCLNAADGKTLWKRTAAEKKPTTSVHSSNTYATETPVTDGERVYAYFGAAGAFCYDLEGKFLWKADLGAYR